MRTLHPNVKLGQQHHRDHFQAIAQSQRLAPGWDVRFVDKQVGKSGLRPDWVLVNEREKRAFIVDLTTKFNPKHFAKGRLYVNELLKILSDYEVVYLEDHWLDATLQ